VEKYVNKKKKFGEDVGIAVDLINLDSSVDEKTVIEKIGYINENNNYAGLIVQMPLPAHINVDNVLSSINKKKDVDAMTVTPLLLSPIVSAVSFIFEKYKIDLSGKNVLVVGRGRLVGQPILNWLASLGVNAS